MAHSIGGVEFDIILGTPPEGLREGVEIWSIMGHDGTASLKTGKAGVTFPLTIGKFGTQAEIETFVAAIEALASEVVDLVYDSSSWNTTYSNIQIREVGTPPQGLRRDKVKESGTWKVRCFIDLICVLTQ